MAKLSTGFRDGIMGAGSAKSLLDGAVMWIFASSTIPASADQEESGTLLMELSVDGDGTGFTFDPVIGEASLVKSTTETWKTNAIDESGDMAYFRLAHPSDSGSASTTAVRVQGTIGTYGGVDLIVSDVAVVSGAPWTLNYFRLSLPTP
jgi:hypothetical protein